MRRLASRATPARRSSGGADSSCWSKASTAIREATSPARAPPIPSATAKTGARSRYESSLLCRCRPTSVRLAFSTTCRATASLLVAVLGVADPDRVARLELLRAVDLALVQVGAVCRAEVLDEHRVAAREDAGVRRRRERILDQHVRRRGSTQCCLAVQLEDRARLVAHRRHDLQARVEAGRP